MQLEAAARIQGLVRKVRSKRLFMKMMKFKRRDDVSYLIELLKRGIPVKKLRSDGGASRKRFLSLSIDDNFAMSRLYTYTNGSMKDTSKGAYLMDLADVRLGPHSFLFQHIRDTFDHKQCISIICGERTWDLEIINGGNSRNWLAGMLLLLVDQILPSNELLRRGRTEGERLVNRKSQGWPSGIRADAERLATVLDQEGLHIKEYTSGGEIKDKMLWISTQNRRMYLGDIPSTVINTATENEKEEGVGKNQTKGIDFDDIAEIRSGLITEELDRKIPNAQFMITVIGSENAFTLLVLKDCPQDSAVLHARIFADLQSFKKIYTCAPAERLSMSPPGSDSGFHMPTDEEYANQKRGGVDEWDDDASSITMWSEADSYDEHVKAASDEQELKSKY